MKKIICGAIMCAAFLLASPVYAMEYPPADKVAHFGVGYIINDQLAKHTKLTPLERIGVVALIAYAKERTDSHVDWRDFAATVGGAVMLEIKF